MGHFLIHNQIFVSIILYLKFLLHYQIKLAFTETSFFQIKYSFNEFLLFNNH